jgi:succinoglycan biosynthesis protein ExoM
MTSGDLPPMAERAAPRTVGQSGAAAGTAVTVTVAVPTYRRPDDLAVLLPALIEHIDGMTAVSDGRWSVEILVVDNDSAASAAAIVQQAGGPRVRYVVEPTPGIAAARNRALDEAAGSRLLAFIDDDERPLAGWLSSLLDTWSETGAAAVSGCVVTDFAGELDPWIGAGDFFVRRNMPTGTELDVAACGNLLLDLDQIRRMGVRFETTLGLAGAEDTLFSRQLARLGGRMVWCNESAAVDAVPPQRMTRAWVLTRAWSNGNAQVMTDLRLATTGWTRQALRLRGAAGGTVRLAAGAARSSWGVLTRSREHQARGMRVALRGAGMIGAALGVVFVEYARAGRRWQLSWLRSR